jgi:hypothetical protein
MQRKALYILIIFSLFYSPVFGQDWTDANNSVEKKDWANESEEKELALFFVGINFGMIFPNNNTAVFYTGASNITAYGIDYLFSIPSYKITFDTYFQYPYYVSEFPQNPSYKSSLDVGLHAGINIGKSSAVYLEVNSSNINFEQVFTVAIDDPNNKSPEPTYEQFPIIGKEKRINFNLGTQLALLHKKKTTIYWSAFGNFNSLKLQRNYVIINDTEYEIIHSNPSLRYVEPGGIGFGGGSGAGIKYRLTDRILADLTYNLYYIKTKMNDNIQGFGLNHGITLRLIWN